MRHLWRTLVGDTGLKVMFSLNPGCKQHTTPRNVASPKRAGVLEVFADGVVCMMRAFSRVGGWAHHCFDHRCPTTARGHSSLVGL